MFCTLIRESGEPSKRKPYLPSEKQFLITRNGKIMELRCFFFFTYWVFFVVIVLGDCIHLLQVCLNTDTSESRCVITVNLFISFKLLLVCLHVSAGMWCPPMCPHASYLKWGNDTHPLPLLHVNWEKIGLFFIFLLLELENPQ